MEAPLPVAAVPSVDNLAAQNADNFVQFETAEFSIYTVLNTLDRVIRAIQGDPTNRTHTHTYPTPTPTPKTVGATQQNSTNPTIQIPNTIHNTHT